MIRLDADRYSLPAKVAISTLAMLIVGAVQLILADDASRMLKSVWFWGEVASMGAMTALIWWCFTPNREPTEDEGEPL